MGKKYIIKLEENEIAYKTVNSNGCPMIGLLHPVPYTEPDIEQVRKEAYEKGWKEAEDHYEKGYNDGYDTGLSDAWECARKIAKLNTGERKRLFGCFGIYFVAHEFSAQEAIEKIRQYEQEKDRQARIEYNFDEIKDVLETTVKECNVSLDEIAEVLQKMKES